MRRSDPEPGQRLRVAIDARWLQRRPLDGVGRYLSNLLPCVADSVDLDLLVDPDLPALSSPWPQHSLRSPGGRAVSWLQLPAPRWLRGYPGIFHAPWYGLPFRQPVPMVVTIHDISFESHPEWFTRARLVSFRAQARWAARTARCILTPSQYVRTRILERYHVAEDRVLVTPHGIDPVFRPEHEPGLAAAALGTESERPYVVAVGNAPRRQADVAVAAWQRACRQGYEGDLVVMGQQLPPAPGLHCLGRIPDEQWAAVLAGAQALCYPTQDEGFGMPALEAAASGVPVVCAPVGALPEVLGGAAQWCDAPTEESIGDGLGQVLGDPARSKWLRQEGLLRAGVMRSWDRSAAGTLAAYALAGHR